jgi:hypothetical protein
MLYYKFETLNDIKESIDFLNNYWGFDITNPESSKFTEDSIIEYQNEFYMIFDANWTFILGVPIEINIPEESLNRLL